MYSGYSGGQWVMTIYRVLRLGTKVIYLFRMALHKSTFNQYHNKL